MIHKEVAGFANAPPPLIEKISTTDFLLSQRGRLNVWTNVLCNHLIRIFNRSLLSESNAGRYADRTYRINPVSLAVFMFLPLSLITGIIPQLIFYLIWKCYQNRFQVTEGKCQCENEKSLFGFRARTNICRCIHPLRPAVPGSLRCDITDRSYGSCCAWFFADLQCIRRHAWEIWWQANNARDVQFEYGALGETERSNLLNGGDYVVSENFLSGTWRKNLRTKLPIWWWQSMERGGSKVGKRHERPFRGQYFIFYAPFYELLRFLGNARSSWTDRVSSYEFRG